MPAHRTPQKYDPRLVRLVQETGDPSIATDLGVPRTTAAGWLRRARTDVVTAPDLDATPLELAARVARLERRVRRLTALLRIVVALLHVLRPDLTRLRIPRAEDKSRLLRAIDRSRGVLGLARALRIAGLSPSRLAAWQHSFRVGGLPRLGSLGPPSGVRSRVSSLRAGRRDDATDPDLLPAPSGRDDRSGTGSVTRARQGSTECRGW